MTAGELWMAPPPGLHALLGARRIAWARAARDAPLPGRTRRACACDGGGRTGGRHPGARGRECRAAREARGDQNLGHPLQGLRPVPACGGSGALGALLGRRAGRGQRTPGAEHLLRGMSARVQGVQRAGAARVLARHGQRYPAQGSCAPAAARLQVLLGAKARGAAARPARRDDDRVVHAVRAGGC